MDSTQFDRLVRTLSTTPTRRGILTALARTTAGTTLAALVAGPRGEDAAAACRQIGELCTSTRQCCRHKHHRRICAPNPQINDDTTCCIPEGKRCEFGGQCCGNADCSDFRCGPSIIVSDRAVKTDFASVDGQAVLAQVAALPIQSWRYRTEERAIRHIGPMAQDFAAAFGVGDDERHIPVVDGQGVALAAIQGLLQELRVLQAQHATLTTRVAALEDRQEG